LLLQVIDPATETAKFADQWRNVFQTAMSVYEIPGNRPADLNAHGAKMLNQFLSERRLAMNPFFTNAMINNFDSDQNSDLNWDVVQAPSFREAPNKTFNLDVHQFFL